jgi:hypothetical protein
MLRTVSEKIGKTTSRIIGNFFPAHLVTVYLICNYSSNYYKNFIHPAGGEGKTDI